MVERRAPEEHPKVVDGVAFYLSRCLRHTKVVRRWNDENYNLTLLQIVTHSVLQWHPHPFIKRYG
jgi:hypothetical protein